MGLRLDVLADAVPALRHDDPAPAAGTVGDGGTRESPRLERELDEHRVYVDGLERRVAELEERLDFTERLLAGRQQSEG